MERRVGCRSVHNFGSCKECCCGVATSNKKKCMAAKLSEFANAWWHYVWSTEDVHKARSNSLLHFDIRNIWQSCTQTWNASARRLWPADMLERWPRVCSVKITCTLLPTNCFVSTTSNSMKCLVNWISQRIRILSRNTQPHLQKLVTQKSRWFVKNYPTH